jgi:hypothetical protein
LIDAVSALRHSLSAPTCEKPITTGLAAKDGMLAAKLTAMAAPTSVLRVNVMLSPGLFVPML